MWSRSFLAQSLFCFGGFRNYNFNAMSRWYIVWKYICIIKRAMNAKLFIRGKTQLSCSPCVKLRGRMRIYPRYFPTLLFFRTCRTVVFVKFCSFFYCTAFFVFRISFYHKYAYRHLCNFSVNSQENLFAFPKHTCTENFRGSEQPV